MQQLVDRRTIHFERDDDAIREIERRQPEWLAQEIALARLFVRIDRKAAYIPSGCASVEELAARKGYDGFRARELLRLGYALEGEPALEDAVRKGEVTFQAGCEIGRIYRDPELIDDQDDWLEIARFTRLRDLKRRIRKRIESVRLGRKTVMLWSAVVGADAVEDLDRCRRVASKKAGQLLTKGQTLTVLSTSYLDLHDVLAKRPRARRMRPTSERPWDRSVPRAVSRVIEERSGGLCEFGSCERPSTELCHLWPHRKGSGREVEDLAGGCRGHHKVYDAGLLKFLGWTNDKLPCFLATDTGEIVEPKPRPEAREPVARPEWLLKAIGKRARLKKKEGNKEPADLAAAASHRACEPWPNLRVLRRAEHCVRVRRTS